MGGGGGSVRMAGGGNGGRVLGGGAGVGTLLLGPFGRRQWSRGHLRLPVLRGVAEAPMGALLLVAWLPALRAGACRRRRRRGWAADGGRCARSLCRRIVAVNWVGVPCRYQCERVKGQR